MKTSGAILHNPDQVAGGKGNIPDFEQVPAPGEEDFDEDKWEAYQKKLEKFIGSSKVNSTIGGQWGFLYLFGQGVQKFDRCLKAWNFLLPTGAEFAVLGRNAHGSILVLQDGDNDVGGHIGVLDATVVQYTSKPDWMFPTLFSQLLPDGVLDVFCDDSAYKKWRAAAKTEKVKLESDMILGIKKPLPLGGSMSVDNFVVATSSNTAINSGRVSQVRRRDNHAAA